MNRKIFLHHLISFTNVVLQKSGAMKSTQYVDIELRFETKRELFLERHEPCVEFSQRFRENI